MRGWDILLESRGVGVEWQLRAGLGQKQRKAEYQVSDGSQGVLFPWLLLFQRNKKQYPQLRVGKGC